MNKLLLITLLVLTTNVLTAQETVKLTGTIEMDKKKVAGLLVTVENQNKGTITDANGHFELQVPVGQQTIMFRLNGIMRHHHSHSFLGKNKYHWEVTIGPKYSSSYLVRMKNEGREEELELSSVKENIYTKLSGTVGFDDMKLPGASVKIQETGEQVNTRSDGTFEIWALEGMQTLEFSFRGFEPFLHKILVDSKKVYALEAKFGPAYTKEFLEKMKAEGKTDQLKRSECKETIN